MEMDSMMNESYDDAIGWWTNAFMNENRRKKDTKINRNREQTDNQID